MLPDSQNKSSILLIIYFLVVFGYTFSLGFYYLPGFLVLTLAFLLLVAFFFFPQIFDNFELLDFSQLLKFTLLISASLSLVCYGGLQQEKGALYNISLFLLMLSVLGVLSYFFSFNHLNFGFDLKFGFCHLNFSELFLKYRFPLLIIISLILRILIVTSSPNPQIDVFDILKNGPKALLQGQNPYSQTYNKIYVDSPSSYFAYPPGILLSVLPFTAFLGDPRYLFIFAEILSAIMIYSILKKAKADKMAEIIPLIFLFNLRWSLVLEQSWIDSLAVFVFAAILFFQTQKQLQGLILPLTTFLITVKQSFIILPLLIIKSFGLKIREIIVSLALISAITLPFFLWGPNDFVKRTITDYFAAFSQRIPLSHRSLSFNSLWFEQTKTNLSNAGLIIVSLLFATAVLLKQKKGGSQFILASTLLYFGIFMFSKTAFLNFYYFIAQMLLLTIVALLSESTTKENNQPTSLSSASQ